MRLQGKVAFITGGNSGIGLATAKLFVAEGAKVALTGRNRATLDAAAKELGAAALAIQADGTSAEETERAVAEAVRAFGKIDIVFANAGIAGPTPIGATTFEAFEEVLRSNVTASFFTVQAAAPHLREGASIILNGSVHAVMGAPGYSAYAAAKAGIRAMTRNLASEFAPRKVRVNQVTPGGTRTPIWAARAPNGNVDALEKNISRGIPFGHFAEATDIANAVLYLASDASSYVTGTELVVDGGATGAPAGSPIYRSA